jgi:hypothetical protein
MKRAPKEMMFFPSCIALIKYRSVTKWDDFGVKAQRFTTWAEAHAFMLDRAAKKVDRAQRDLKSAERHLAKVKTMEEPSVTAANTGERT